MNLEAWSGQLFPHFLHFLCPLSFFLPSLSSPPPRFSSPPSSVHCPRAQYVEQAVLEVTEIFPPLQELKASTAKPGCQFY